ncbi:sensor domain-containing diguanylate cyclase [Paenibacillus sp. NFR01]|uniref:sensor domain-containing diguanylate cyclase n=1 Tax=Paenibacillus sp. NFR01 TaxID=1566279 RepID=UPI0008B03525|nr:sensor domain-containing diguanylate cyclase [Paenibacillus sp. NFR01]SET47721.1 diguanylate cyclase (GGDEF) domain-containing protein [Paenibacillus sp. NFR01]
MLNQEAYGQQECRMLFQDTIQVRQGSSDPAAWLGDTDILSHDFPFADVLIAESFAEWHKTAVPPFAEGWSFGALNFEGRWIVPLHTNSEDTVGGEAMNAGLWTEAVQTSLMTGEIGSVTDETTEPEQALLVLPARTRGIGEIFALLACAMPLEQERQGGRFALEAMAMHFRTCFYRRFEHLLVSDLAGVHQHAERESNRRSLLFQIVSRMHDNIDVSAVLSEVLDSISAMYPEARLELFMSQDHRSTHPQIKPLAMRWGAEDVCTKAFKDGRIAVNAGCDDQSYVEIGLPLGGKQGIYGVFHMIVDSLAFPEIDLGFLTMVAETAGTAFENAKLYERSNQLIRELRMSNELTQRLNQSLRLGDIFQYAFEELLEMFSADYCCIMHMNEEKGGLEVIACNYFPLLNEILEAGTGLGGTVYMTGEPIIVGDYTGTPATSSRLMEATRCQSVIATPLNVGGEVRGAIMLAHKDPHFFSFDSFRLLQAMAGHIGLAVNNARLHAEVRYLANRDSLTGLYARHYLDEEIKERQSKDFCGSLIVVDIDQFKMVNDTYGHQRGDKILKQVSEVVKTSIRHGDIAARWGGEELAVYLPQLGVQQAERVAERIRKRVMGETEPRVTVSCGVAEWGWTDERVSVESLFYRADMALYEAKHSGRNLVVVDKKNTDGNSKNPTA